MGLGVSLAIVVTVSAIAYVGGLPDWFGRGNVDKVLHFTMTATLMFFTDGVLRRRAAFRSRFAPPLSAIVVLLPVGVEEYLQRLSVNRSSSIWDFVADVLGVIAGAFATRAVARRLHFRRPSSGSG